MFLIAVVYLNAKEDVREVDIKHRCLCDVLL